MRYVSVLRGINVSGQKKIKMIDLAGLYEELGYKNIATYIQSGNVIFDTNIKSRAQITESIEKAIQDRYGFDVPVLLRTNTEIGRIIEDCPFSHIDYDKDGTKVLVTFASTKPNKERLSGMRQYVHPPEELKASGTEIYLYCPNGYGKSKLSNNFLENKLGILATTRNIKTVCKLHELSS